MWGAFFAGFDLFPFKGRKNYFHFLLFMYHFNNENKKREYYYETESVDNILIRCFASEWWACDSERGFSESEGINDALS